MFISFMQTHAAQIYCIGIAQMTPASQQAKSMSSALSKFLGRHIREGHRCAALRLGVDDGAKEAMEELLAELQQLLVGISIMQVVLGSTGSLFLAGVHRCSHGFVSWLVNQSSDTHHSESSDHQVLAQLRVLNHALSCTPQRALVALLGYPRTVSVTFSHPSTTRTAFHQAARVKRHTSHGSSMRRQRDTLHNE